MLINHQFGVVCLEGLSCTAAQSTQPLGPSAHPYLIRGSALVLCVTALYWSHFTVSLAPRPSFVLASISPKAELPLDFGYSPVHSFATSRVLIIIVIYCHNVPYCQYNLGTEQMNVHISMAKRPGYLQLCVVYSYGNTKDTMFISA